MSSCFWDSKHQGKSGFLIPGGGGALPKLGGGSIEPSQNQDWGGRGLGKGLSKIDRPINQLS